MSTQFKIGLSDKADPKIQLAAFAYNRRNQLVGMAPIEKGVFSFSSEKISFRLTRILIAPVFADDPKDLPINQLLKRKPFEVTFPRKIDKVVDLGFIPDFYYPGWLFCVCTIRGRVMNSRCENPNIPVDGARVHICEVDSIFNIINIVPDWKIINLRDWILRYVDLREIVKIPPIINWPPIGPDPGPIEDIIRGKVNILDFQKEKRSLVFNPMLQKQPDQVAALVDQSARVIEKYAQVTNELTFGEEKIPLSKILPADNMHMFFSNDASLVRKYFIDFHEFIFPNICRYISWFYTYDEIATVTSDSNGNFSYQYFYNCKDHPDVYIWVEYPVDGVYTTVYRPYVGCSTIWNYVCGSDIIIHVNNPLIPCVNEPDVNVGAKSVVVFSMGENVNVANVEQGAGATGIPRSGAFRGGPFGSTIDPRVYFHKSLASNVNNPGGLNYLYRWSYRRFGATDWAIMGSAVTRHFEDTILPGNIPVFPAYQIGPDANMLYQILKFYTPDNKPLVTKYASDLADAYFQTGSLNANPDLTDGLYEIKMELYKYVGGVEQRVNWTAEGITLYVPTQDIINFQNTTITVETDPTKVAPYQYRLHPVGGNLVESAPGSGFGDIYGFYMKMFVDNNKPEINIPMPYVDAPNNHPDCCRFVKYVDGNSLIYVNFKAKQKNDFASFNVGIGGFEAIGEPIQSGTLNISMHKEAILGEPAIADELFMGDTLGNYSGTIHVSGALAGCIPACTKKVISYSLGIQGTAHNGTSWLWNPESTGDSFAIES
jgi:hypothetical protein